RWHTSFSRDWSSDVCSSDLMISTTSMIQLGRVKGNKMVDMQLSNNKLVDRGTRMIMEELSVNYEEAKELLIKFGNVRNAITNYRSEERRVGKECTDKMFACR